MGERRAEELTAFYEANERAAEEVRRLLRAGALDGLVAILREAGLRLELETYSARARKAELLGFVEPGEAAGEARFDYEDFLAQRVEQWVPLGEGGARERVVMPDHICPRCGNEQDNYIVDTAKTCIACRFQW